MKIADEDAALDRLWRDRFNQPLPMRGATDIVKRILIDNGVNPRRIEMEMQSARRDGDKRP